MEVQIKGKTVKLAAPSSHSSRQVVMLAVAQNAWIGLGAVLGVCLPARPALKATLSAHKFDGLAYGAAVRDELHALGVTDEELATAASAALKLLVDSYPREAEVEAAADFTGAPKADSTP
ncbi:MAG: hypothetical protein RIT24_1617 [Planctomycetota bacterium]